MKRRCASILMTVIGLMAFSGASTKADTVELNNGDVLTGTIESLERGLVVLRSALAQQPLEIKSSAIKKISFSAQTEENPIHTERLTLANNDVVPCKVLSMDEKQLHISTWYAGEFSIPRTNIRALQFGISKEQTVFVGTAPPAKWSVNNGSWLQSGNTYRARSTATLAQKLDLPENVRFQFNLAWKQTPNFAFRFCAEKDSPTTKQDTYELLFNSAGMQIRRYENANQPAALLASVSIRPSAIEDRKVDIDLRVNRSEGLVSLYVDSALIGTWSDPFAKSAGDYIIFNSRTSRRDSCILSDIKVTALHDGLLPRHREKASIAKTDVLIDSEGEKISGELSSISAAEPNKRMVVLNVKHSEAPLMVPDRRISTLLFAKPDDSPNFQHSTFTAVLNAGGRLQLENPKLVDGKLTSLHPILGPCILSPKAISHISQSKEHNDNAAK